MFVLDARTLAVERLFIPNPETFSETSHGSDENVDWAAFSPDGERLATANADGSVRIFRVRDGEPVLKFQAHPESVESLAFSPDGLTLLTTSFGGLGVGKYRQARLWNTADGALARKLIEKPDCCMFRGVFSPDGDRVAIAESDAVSIWDARIGKKLLRLDGVKSSPLDPVAFSPDGSRLAAADEGKVVRVWDAQSGQEVLTLRGHEGDVGSVAFSPNGRHILTTGCCFNAEALVWDAKSGARVGSLLGHAEGGGVRSAAFSPDGHFIVTAGQDHTVRLWEFTPGAPTRLLRDEGGASGFQFSPDGSLIAAIGTNPAVLVWRPGQDTPVRLPTEHGDRSGFVFSPDGSRMLVFSDPEHVSVYDARTLERVG
ncbi:MAG: WD40 repeat domain-containing protein, partial [Gammaproteobacteria bacterium]